MNPSQRLAMLQRSVAIPAGGASAFTPPVNGTDLADVLPTILFYVLAPAMTTSELPDGQTFTYTLVESNDPAFGSTISTTVMGVQTGAGSAGAAAAAFAAQAKLQGGRYIGLKIAASSTANAAGTSITLAIAAT
jgi:hypothetical protein